MEPRIEPGGRQPAPGQLALVQAFVNTVDLEDLREDLGSPELLRGWLAARDLIDGVEPLDEGDLQRALAFREALRALLLANNDGILDAAAIEALNQIAGQASLLVHFALDGRAQLAPATTGLEMAIGRLLAIIYAAIVDGSWPRLKACRSDICRWAFYDASKNRGGAWCSMAICGSRSKARTYRRRQTAQTR